MKQVWDFFETLPSYEMSPHPELVDNGFCLAKPGEMYLVYLTEPGRVNIGLKPASYNVEWINAQNTSDRRSSEEFQIEHLFTSPQEGDDWLLWLTAAK